MRKFLFSFILFSTQLIFPNAGFVGTGNVATGQLKLLESDQISIEDEILSIDLQKGFADVVVTYLMKNHGGETEVQLGFPGFNFDEQIGANNRTKREITKYSILDNKIKLPVSIIEKKVNWFAIPEFSWYDKEHGGKPTTKHQFFVSKLKFSKNEIKTIRISYTSYYYELLGGTESNMHRDSDIFYYLLSFGSSWKGPIKKGRVVIHTHKIGNEFVYINNSDRFKNKKGTYTWEFENLEPKEKDNILIKIHPEYVKMFNFNDAYGDTINFYDVEKEYLASIKPKTIKASSILDNNDEIYGPQKTFQWRNGGWAEGKDDAGIGESIEMELKSPTVIHTLGFINGYIKTRSLFEKNNRIKKIEITFNDEYSTVYTLKDVFTHYLYLHLFAYQLFENNEYTKPVKKIKLTIKDIYRGTHYNDTCLSGILILQKLKERPNPGGR
jgi:hypothetical protein